MQERSQILADSLTARPFHSGDADRNTAAMAYLLTPVTSELTERIRPVVNQNAQWRWFDCYPAPDEFGPNKMVTDSFLDSALPSIEIGTLDGIVINLQLGWLDFERVFFLCRQWLKPGGQLFFSSPGPDTLFELREAWQSIDQFAHVHEFPDLHMLGDQLSKNGFEKPVLDTDWQGVEFEDIDLLISDLRSQGCVNRHRDRRRMLTGKARFAALQRYFDDQQPVQMTFEIIYGYARVPKERSDGIHVIAPSL